MFVSGRRLKLRRRFAVVTLVSFNITAVAIQYFFPKYLVIDFAAALSLLLMYITMQSSSEISDPLTKAYNYNALVSLISENLNNRRHFIILGYSLSDVRHINEVYGETYGDELLIHTAQILNTLGGFTARIYGDEFCVLLERDITVEQFYDEVEKLPRVFKSGKYEIPVSASKVILDSSDFTSCPVLLELMDFAFRNNKKYGSEKTVIVNQILIQKYNRREKVCAAVARAVGEKNINVVYQPIVDAYTGKVIAAEALARLNGPELGPIPPDEFITIAEQNGLILDLGKCVREKVWKLLSEYDIREAGINHISVNLSSVECTQKAAMEKILEEAERYSIEPGLIAFEVTETAAVASKDILAFNLNMMRSKGFEFHLDDYGTGYSSMSNLISLPFSVIKFDKSIMKLAMEPQRGDLIKHSIAPMHGYGIKIVIEGIETEEQAEKARGWKVDYFQGFLYSEPLPQNIFLEYACIMKKTEKQLQTV
jgi:EAL domain-containing protein (putative c-di-GMP-specific phosphodiesterase class I)/GGDEF domain-containing protein